MDQQLQCMPPPSTGELHEAAEVKPNEPNDAIVQQVIQIMERLLKIRPLTAESRFIDLTSDIRRAFIFIREFQRRFNFELPISSFFDSPSIGDLAHIAAIKQTPPLSRLVLLRGGDESVPPLFLLPGLGSVVFELLGLAKEIAYPGATYGITAPGLDGVGAPPRDIACFAQENFDLVRSIYPTGPYRLLGHSAGGLIAFEMAHYAAEHAAKVDFFGVLDTNFAERSWPVTIWLRFMMERARGANRMAANEAHDGANIGQSQAARSAGTGGGRKAREIRAALYGRASQLRRIWRKISHRFLMNPASEAYVKADPYYIANLPSKFQNVRDAAISMVARYRPSCYDGELYLFQAEFGDKLSCNPLLTWSRLVREIILLPVPGDHITMLSKPHVSAVARTVSICLAEIERSRRLVMTPGTPSDAGV